MTHGRLVMIVLTSVLVVEALGGYARSHSGSTTLDAELLEAAREGDTASVRRLLKQGANIETKDQGGSTALALAADYGHADTVNLLLVKGADPVAGRVAGDDALIEAAERVAPKKVELLSKEDQAWRPRTRLFSQ